MRLRIISANWLFCNAQWECVRYLCVCAEQWTISMNRTIYNSGWKVNWYHDNSVRCWMSSPQTCLYLYIAEQETFTSCNRLMILLSTIEEVSRQPLNRHSIEMKKYTFSPIYIQNHFMINNSDRAFEKCITNYTYTHTHTGDNDTFTHYYYNHWTLRLIN